MYPSFHIGRVLVELHVCIACLSTHVHKIALFERTMSERHTRYFDGTGDFVSHITARRTDPTHSLSNLKKPARVSVPSRDSSDTAIFTDRLADPAGFCKLEGIHVASKTVS